MKNITQLLTILVVFLPLVVMADFDPLFNVIDRDNVQNVVVFGDQFVDTGNVYDLTSGAFPPSAFFDGNTGGFSNGRTFWQRIVQDDLGWSDEENVQQLGYGGAGVDADWSSSTSVTGLPPDVIPVPGFKQQVDAYLEDSPVSPAGTLFFVNVGGNDMFVQPPPTTSTDIGIWVDQVTTRVAENVLALLSTAAPSSWVITVGVLPLGELPAVQVLGEDAVTLYNSLSAVFNGVLSLKIKGLDEQIANATLGANRALWVDPTAEFAVLRSNPAAQGFDAGLQDVCRPGLIPSSCDEPMAYFWWDDFGNPTASAHQWLGDLVWNSAFVQSHDGSSAASITVCVLGSLFATTILAFF